EAFVRALGAQGSRLVLITLSYEKRNAASPTKLYDLGRLSNESLRQVITAESDKLPIDVAERITKFADGFPRVAKLLVDSISSGATSEHDLLSITVQNLMDRLIGGSSDYQSERFRKTRKVLS